MKVEIFIPCFIDQIYPQTGMNMVKVLEKAGCEVTYNPSQTCCGFNQVFPDQAEATAVARKFLHDFDPATYIVGPSGSCTGFVRNYYDHMFHNSTDHLSCTQLTGHIFEFTEFLTNVLKITNVGAKLEGKATYHDACGALRDCSIKEGPRKLLAEVQGLELIEMTDAETCCGFGGTFAVKYEPISIGMAQAKVKNALDAGAQYIISTDASCLMHLQGYIAHHNLPITTMHIADVLASGW
ncbi:MAG: (Fe-S)-binding protein [Chitinophagia bacterium]|nr:(Fe-S)-binding protein [Chitinophagia bacterium]